MSGLRFSFLFFFLISVLGTEGQVCIDTMDFGSDTSLCTGQTIVFDAGGNYLDYSWSTGDTVQSISVGTSGTYSCLAHIVDSTTLVVNGDFSSGNTFFTSSYVYGTGGPYGQLSNEGEYAISTNSSLTHTNFANCTDHTTGTGNFMIVNGATSGNTHIWCETIGILPNTDYIFSAWFTSVHASNPAILNFTINNVAIGPNVNLSSTTCNWQNFFQTWNSGPNVNATICITNQNTALGGNDFALDDIYFAMICAFTDTVEVEVFDYPVVDLGPDVIFCQGDSIIIDATADTISTYLWHNGDTTATYTAYSTEDVWVQVSNGHCSDSDSMHVEVLGWPIVDLGNDTTICDGGSVMLDANNAGATYLWSDGSTNPGLLVSVSGSYWVVVSNGICQVSDTVNVNISTGPVADLGPDRSLCFGDSLTLYPGAATHYLWSTGETSASITVYAYTPATYSVQLSDDFSCISSDNINIDVIAIPEATILQSDDSICAGEAVELIAGGGDFYSWSNGSTTQSITVKPFISSSYYVTVSNSSNGVICYNDTTTSISVLSCNYFYLPNAFTPDGDGLNDEIGPVGILEGYELYEFFVFDRWGAQIFYTTDFKQGWNGTINGKQAVIGTYTYVIILKEANKVKEYRKGIFNLVR